MARKKQPWFRVYTEIISDRRLRRLPESHRWIWLGLLAIAKLSESNGQLLIGDGIRADFDDIADMIGTDIDIVEKAIKKFIELKMLKKSHETYLISGWNDRQFLSDDSTARVQKHRANK